jgi:hypothetical protein
LVSKLGEVWLIIGGGLIIVGLLLAWVGVLKLFGTGLTLRLTLKRFTSLAIAVRGLPIASSRSIG